MKKYREEWKREIWDINHDIDHESKQKIIEKVGEFPVKVEIDKDGSRLIEFEVWWRKWTLLDPKLEVHSDAEYLERSITTKRIETVKLWWMKWDNVDMRKNKKLAEYVKQKEVEWLHIPKIEEIKELLKNLWVEADLDKESDQIAMLMYLTGMDWNYRLSMWSDKRSKSQGKSRSLLACFNPAHDLRYDFKDSSSASLCMISCQ